MEKQSQISCKEEKPVTSMSSVCEEASLKQEKHENLSNKVLSKKTPKKDQPWNVQSKPEFTISGCPVVRYYPKIWQQWGYKY